MTVVGKILTIVNLVLSLAVGAFIIMTYVARTNWHAAYVNMQSQYTVAKEDAEAYKKEMETCKGEKAKADEQLAKAQTDIKKNKDAADEQLKGAALKLKDANAAIGYHMAAQNAAGAELKRRANEVDYLNTLVAVRDQDLTRMRKQVDDMQNTMVEATINANSERERNGRLLQENERLVKVNQQLQQAAGATTVRGEAPKKNPPAEDIEGLVKKTDAQSGYVTVSVGSDAGLGRGNTLEVYRLKPDPKYLGTIEILAVRPNEAVGKPIDNTRRLIQVGDQVSSSIVRRR